MERLELELEFGIVGFVLAAVAFTSAFALFGNAPGGGFPDSLRWFCGSTFAFGMAVAAADGLDGTKRVLAILFGLVALRYLSPMAPEGFRFSFLPTVELVPSLVLWLAARESRRYRGLLGHGAVLALGFGACVKTWELWGAWVVLSSTAIGFYASLCWRTKLARVFACSALLVFCLMVAELFGGTGGTRFFDDNQTIMQWAVAVSIAYLPCWFGSESLMRRVFA